MPLQTLEFVDENLAITGMMAMPVAPTPGVQYGFEADPNTGLFVPVASTAANGGAPAQEFLIGGQQWNILSHTLGTDRVQAIITFANPMQYSNADGSVTGSYYPKYEPVGHGIILGMETSGYIVDLGPNYPGAESIYVLLFAVGMDAAVAPGGAATSTGDTAASTGTLTFAVTPQPARTGNTYTINITGAQPGEAVTVDWAASSPGGASSYTYTANNQGQVVDTDVAGSANSPVGNYSGTVSSASGMTGSFSYTLG